MNNKVMIILFFCRKFKFIDNIVFKFVNLYLRENKLLLPEYERNSKFLEEMCNRDLVINKRVVYQPKGK